MINSCNKTCDAFKAYCADVRLIDNTLFIILCNINDVV